MTITNQDDEQEDYINPSLIQLQDNSDDKEEN